MRLGSELPLLRLSSTRSLSPLSTAATPRLTRESVSVHRLITVEYSSSRNQFGPSGS
ncbi:hypothetical protein YC2023_040072 [Brassica napus]